MLPKKLIICFLILFSAVFSVKAHVGGHKDSKPETYFIKGKSIEGHFLMAKNDKVFIELKNGKMISAVMSDFSFSNQHNISEKIARFKKLNGQENLEIEKGRFSINYLIIFCGICLIIFFGFYIKSQTNQFSKFAYVFVTFALFLYACKTAESVIPGTITATTAIAKTDPAFLETVFGTFKTLVKTRFDDTYFYVESEGIPAHNMMVGITNWQQQVPTPQGYTGTNAWSIPLKPEYATTPLSLKTNLLKGAVAIAPNGVPIFNPLNNRGEDAFLIGELDQWGGHCGKADDYHYHIAPLHFEATSGKNPIAVALDGFAIYGSKEPDGSTMQALDANNGHAIGTAVYHYHATTNYPYFIGAMRGKITLDPATAAPENQISPQAKMTPLRPPGEPLKGAGITNFKSTGTNAYSLEYTLTSKKGYINYSWDAANKYTFTFIGIDGKSTTSTYLKK
jgi:YHYH protein